jgi:hypothetical protein
MTETTLLEPSMADVLEAIGTAIELNVSKKAHWSCSVRQICSGIGRPAENIPGRWSGVSSRSDSLRPGYYATTKNAEERG